MELRSGGVGTDNVDAFIGMPKIAMPGPLPLELPEVRLWEKKSQFGTVKIGVVAYATQSGQLLFDSGRALARADDSRWSLLGVGPFQKGSVRSEIARATSNTDFGSRVAGAVDSSMPTLR
jgi:hypothetical protein